MSAAHEPPTVPERIARAGNAEVRVFASVDGLSSAVAQAFLRACEQDVARYGRFTVALSGGSTPRAVNARIAALGQRLPWDRIQIFFGDERAVPPEHPDSNYRMAEESLLSRVPIPRENVHRIRAEGGAERAAAEYEDSLAAVFGPGAVPSFDLIFLGMGPDGHTASLFPGSPAIAESKRLVVANPVTTLNAERITFTFPVLNHARRVWFLVVGGDKAATVQQVLEGGAAEPYPAQRVHPPGELVWWVDVQAAAALRHLERPRS